MRSHIQHIHQRTKKTKHEPASNKLVYWLDKIVLAAAFIGPLTTFPQIYEIFKNQSAGDISILTWTLFGLLSIPWLIYGLIHKQAPIIVSSILWILVDFIVVFSAVIYS